MIRFVFDTYGAPVLVIMFITLFIIESKLQLRKRVQRRWKRIIVNFILAIPAFVLLRLLLIPAMVWLAVQNETWHFGLSYVLAVPTVFTWIICFLAIDYSNYIWHILLHKLPVLWRFHLVHHTDLDLDVSTAFRFHFGEMIASIFFRGGAILVTGASPLMVLVYEIAYEAATQFHHSNTKLNFAFEKVLNFFVVTPRMHGIHHSVIRKETDSNYSIIFSWWDRLHKTATLNVHQNKVRIGVPSYHDEKELTIGMLLKMPFTRERAWPHVERHREDDPGKLKP